MHIHLSIQRKKKSSDLGKIQSANSNRLQAIINWHQHAHWSWSALASWSHGKKQLRLLPAGYLGINIGFNSIQCWSSTSRRLQKSWSQIRHISFFFHQFLHFSFITVFKQVWRDELDILYFHSIGWKGEILAFNDSGALSGIFRITVFSLNLLLVSLIYI
jgi:hypothetical protein